MSGSWSLVTLLDSADCPVELVALRIARDEYPLLAVHDELQKIDALAKPLLSAAAAATDAEAQATILSSYVYDRLGFHGNEDNYYDPRNSYLNDVMQRRTGIPISLAVLLMAIGRRVGIEVEGIGFPGHFLVRIGGADGVLLDPFRGGRRMTHDGLHQLAGKVLPNPEHVSQSYLAPVDLRAMSIRMLINLKLAHERRGDHARALVACDRLYDLTRSAYFRRDRGLHALALGASQAAAADLHAYLAQSPNAADVGYVRRVIQTVEHRPSAVLQ